MEIRVGNVIINVDQELNEEEKYFIDGIANLLAAVLAGKTVKKASLLLTSVVITLSNHKSRGQIRKEVYMKKLYKTIILGLFLKAFKEELGVDKKSEVDRFMTSLLEPYV